MGPVRALQFGFGADYPKVPEAHRPMLAKRLGGLVSQFAEAGIDYEFVGVSPEEGLAAVGPKLQSFRPDCVIIGNGIRSQMGLTHFMEQLIDVVRTSAPKAKLGFNTVPEDSLDAVRRWFPTADK